MFKRFIVLCGFVAYFVFGLQVHSIGVNYEKRVDVKILI